jgi:uncharacterized caspase-like protein
MIFLDTCHAGSVANPLGGTSADTARLSNMLSAPENSVIVFAASTDRQESTERDELLNGAFTHFLVNGLRGAARLPAQPIVTTRSLMPFVVSGVSTLTKGKQTPIAVIPDFTPERILANLGAP